MDEFFAENRLSAYIDNELPEEERPGLETSIRENPRLRVKYSRMLTAVELVREKAAVHAPPGLDDRILERLKKEGLVQGRWQRMGMTLFLSVLLLATLATAALSWMVQRDQKGVLSSEEMERDLPLGTVLLPSAELNEDAPENLAPEEVAPIAPTLPSQPSAEEATIHPVVEMDIPTWEEEYALNELAGAPSNPSAFFADEERELLGSYRLYPEDQNALWTLHDEISELGGELKVGGRGLRRLNNEDNFARVQLRIPEAGLAQLVSLLQQLGPLHQVQPPAESPEVLLQIEVQFRP